MTSEMPFHEGDIIWAKDVLQAHSLASWNSTTLNCHCGRWSQEKGSSRQEFARHRVEEMLRALVSAGWKSPKMVAKEDRDRLEFLASVHPEPPDGTRIEFQEHGSPGGDLIAIYRDDASSAEAGWPVGNGGKVWCEYGRSVPMTWIQVLADPRLAAAIGGKHLIVKPEPRRVKRVFAAASTQQHIPNDVDVVRDKDQKIWTRIKGASGIPYLSDPWRVPGSFTYPYVDQAKLLRDYGPVVEVLS